LGKTFLEKSFPQTPFKKLQTNKKAKYVQTFGMDLHDALFHLFV